MIKTTAVSRECWHGLSSAETVTACVRRCSVWGGEVGTGKAAEVHDSSGHFQHQPHHRAGLSGHGGSSEANVHVRGGAGLWDITRWVILHSTEFQKKTDLARIIFKNDSWLLKMSLPVNHQLPSFHWLILKCLHVSPLAANLPPTLAKSQVSSVRKNLKLHLVSVLKHPCSLEFQGQISTLLLDLGMPQSEITRSTPAPREPRKRTRHEQYTEGKKVKMGESWLLSDIIYTFLDAARSGCCVCSLKTLNAEPALMEDDDDKEEPPPLAVPKPTTVPVAQSAIDLTAEFLHPLLNPENVANLVSGKNHLIFFKCLYHKRPHHWFLSYSRFSSVWCIYRMSCQHPSRPHTLRWSPQALTPKLNIWLG